MKSKAAFDRDMRGAVGNLLLLSSSAVTLRLSHCSSKAETAAALLFTALHASKALCSQLQLRLLRDLWRSAARMHAEGLEPTPVWFSEARLKGARCYFTSKIFAFADAAH